MLTIILIILLVAALAGGGWGHSNVGRVDRLRKAGRMTKHGQAQVDAAKANGRWEAACPSPRALQVPEDFVAAVSRNSAALETYRGLNKENINAIAYRLHHLASPERRAKFVADMVAKLSRGETPHPSPRRPVPAPQAGNAQTPTTREFELDRSKCP